MNFIFSKSLKREKILKTIIRVKDVRGKGLYQSLWQKAIVETFNDFNEDDSMALLDMKAS